MPHQGSLALSNDTEWTWQQRSVHKARDKEGQGNAEQGAQSVRRQEEGLKSPKTGSAMWRVTERQHQELQSLGITNGSVWARQCTQYVYACPHLHPHPHGAHVSITCNGLVRAGEEVHLSVFECTSWQSCRTSGSRPLCVEMGCSWAKKSPIARWTASPGIQSLPPRTETTNSSYDTQRFYWLKYLPNPKSVFFICKTYCFFTES